MPWDGVERRSGKDRRSGRDRRVDLLARIKWAEEHGADPDRPDQTIPEALWDRRSGLDRRGHPMYQNGNGAHSGNGRAAEGESALEPDLRPVER